MILLMSHFQLNLKQCVTSSPSSSHSTTVYYYTLAPNIYQVFTLIMSEKRSRCHHITPREIFLSGYELFCQATHSFFQLGVGWIVEVGCLVLLNTQYIAAAATDFTGCNDLIEAWWEKYGVFTSPYTSCLLTGCKMTRSTKMHWYLSFSKLVQLNQSLQAESLVCSGKLVLLDKFFSSSAQRRRAQKELSGDNYTRKELEALLHQMEVIWLCDNNTETCLWNVSPLLLGCGKSNLCLVLGCHRSSFTSRITSINWLAIASDSGG